MENIIDLNSSYTFRDYFDKNLPIKPLLAHFGYTLKRQRCQFPVASLDKHRLQELQNRLEEGLPYLNLNNEVARREFLIAPLLWEAIRYTQAELSVEVPIEVNQYLKGNLDYFLEKENNLLVVEAKHGDPQKGFTQLAVELVALDAWIKKEDAFIYGAVSMGESWRFGLLDRANQKIIQDINLYGVPTALEQVMRILVAILNGSSADTDVV